MMVGCVESPPAEDTDSSDIADEDLLAAVLRVEGVQQNSDGSAASETRNLKISQAEVAASTGHGPSKGRGRGGVEGGKK